MGFIIILIILFEFFTLGYVFKYKIHEYIGHISQYIKYYSPKV